MVLASMDTSIDLNKLADMADKVMEVATPTVSAITSTNLEHTKSSEVEKLREEVAKLTDIVASLSTRFRQRSNSRSRRSRSPARSSNSSDSLCWYHAKYGEKAEKCRIPCNWGNDQARPGTSGDRCRWPKSQSPILRQRSQLWHSIFS